MGKNLGLINFISTQKQLLYRICQTASGARWAVAAAALFFFTAREAVNKIYGEIPSAQAQAPNAPNLKLPAFLLNEQGVEQLN
ncbi:hypothetical protein [Microcoleus sp. herbarium12]|uniref:hypothetical protein n=1 Tax=Microcoleus sp. herbarium12 TaxID=3055437 RepID=UPI002FD6202C